MTPPEKTLPCQARPIQKTPMPTAAWQIGKKRYKIRLRMHSLEPDFAV